MPVLRQTGADDPLLRARSRRQTVWSSRDVGSRVSASRVSPDGAAESAASGRVPEFGSSHLRSKRSLYPVIQIKPHNVTNLASKLRIVAELERLYPVWLQLVLFPDTLHGCGTDVLRRCPCSHAPLCSVLGDGLHGGIYNSCFLFL